MSQLVELFLVKHGAKNTLSCSKKGDAKKATVHSHVPVFKGGVGVHSSTTTYVHMCLTFDDVLKKASFGAGDLRQWCDEGFVRCSHGDVGEIGTVGLLSLRFS